MKSGDFLTVVSDAIMMSSMKADTQIIFDGEQFHIEEVVLEDFIRGYVIRHKAVDIPIGEVKFEKWLSNLLFIHCNSCTKYFREKKEILIMFVD